MLSLTQVHLYFHQNLSRFRPRLWWPLCFVITANIQPALFSQPSLFMSSTSETSTNWELETWKISHLHWTHTDSFPSPCSLNKSIQQLLAWPLPCSKVQAIWRWFRVMVGWHGVHKWQLHCHSVPGTSAWVEVASWGLESIPPCRYRKTAA